ncbi:MAG: DUF503 domain-containing protein, partial [Deltaproteobacteria bacterium HGW-Deltaproteobacteria-20]
KDRRQVVRSFKERVQARLRISVAEVGDLERPSYAVVAMAVVSNEAAVCDEVLAKAATMASTLANAVLADRATEVVPYGHGGSGIRGGIEQLRLSEDSDWSEDEEEEDAR